MRASGWSQKVGQSWTVAGDRCGPFGAATRIPLLASDRKGEFRGRWI
jgi:hypothetical protein